jgi:L-ascorbate metabolism protein UlaG (beta-lactamase superfamily)
MKSIVLALGISMIFACNVILAQTYQQDVIQTGKGDLKITFIKHASLVFEYDDKVIHIDPVLRMGDYSTLPKADLIMITHAHGDHFDLNAIEKIRKPSTKLVVTKKCMEASEHLENASIMNDHEEKMVAGINVRSIPAYNIKHKRDNGTPYHPKGEGNGYIFNFGNKKVYVAGDTENTPEMKSLGNIDVAFLPMNLPYTMTPEMVADAARAFNPEILYPYHFGKTDTQQLVDLLAEEKNIDVRIRNMGY